MENDKIIFYLNDKLNLCSEKQGTNYNNKATLTFFEYKRPHLEYSC